MARGIRPAAVLIAVLVTLVVTGMSAAAEPTPGRSIEVTADKGQELKPGTYHGTVSRNEKTVDVTIVVPTAATPPGGGTGVPTSEPTHVPSPDPNPNRSRAGQLVLTGLALLLVAVGGAMLYLRVLAPRRYLRPYLRALAQVRAKRYDLALPALTRLEATLPEQVRAEARFFIAFAMYRLDDRQAAEHRLAELNREDPANVEVAYLLAHLRADRRDFDGAEAVLSRLDPAVRDAPGNLRRLYGVVTAQRAFAAFREGRVDAAAELFEQVERLGDFADHVPVDLRNRNILVGTKALFDRDVPAAREQFESLRRAAGRIGGTQSGPLFASAELGLALGAWLATEKDSAAETERQLVAALALLDPIGALTAHWPPESAEPGLTARIEEMMIRANRPAEEIEAERTLRDIHFLRGMAVLRAWAETGPEQARSAAGDFLRDAVHRFARARELDPEFSDVYVVVGLLRYYLAESDSDRRSGVAVLRQAQKLGTRDPEVLQILNHDERVRQANRDAADAYLQILDQYIRDTTVREEVREALLARLHRFGKVRDWDTRPEQIGRRVVTPTVAEMHARSALLMARVNDLVGSQGSTTDLSGAYQLTMSLEHRSREIAEYARAIEDQEAELLALLGDKLLSEVEA